MRLGRDDAWAIGALAIPALFWPALFLVAWCCR